MRMYPSLVLRSNCVLNCNNRKNFKTRGQEARLYSACAAGILFPIAMFIYAWTSFENVNWVGMAVGITVSKSLSFYAYPCRAILILS